MSRLLDTEPWDVILASRIPVLVIGRAIIILAFIEELRPQLPVPVVDVWCGASAPRCVLEATGTVVLHNIERLRFPDQDQVMTLLEMQVARPQVISTSSGPLLPLVATGEFLETLHYRINTVCIHLSADDL